MRDLLDAALARSPAQPLLLRRAGRRLTVLAYHAVDDPQRFGDHLDLLLERSFRPLSQDELLATLAGRRELPPRAAVLTFDDGDRSVLERGLPLLVERGIPGIAFVVAGLLDTDRAPWWQRAAYLAQRGGRSEALGDLPPARLVVALKGLPDGRRRATIEELEESAGEPAPPAPQLTRGDLRRLEAGGVAIGNHSFDHPCLTRCGDGEVERQLVKAHRALEDTLGHPPRTFAYPNGDLDPRAEPVLHRLGYEAGFLFDHRTNRWPPADALRISRVRVGSHVTADRFRILLSGLHPALHRAVGRR